MSEEKNTTKQEDASSVKNIGVSQEDGARKLAECEKILEETTKSVNGAISALVRIYKEELFKFAFDKKTGKPFATFDAYVRSRGFSRSWICRTKKYVKGLAELEIPEGKEPTEGAMRKLLSGGFSLESRKKIHENAVATAGMAERDIPIAADYKTAIDAFAGEDEIYLSSIGESVSRDADFTTGVLKEYEKKIYTVGILLAVIKTFKTRMALSEEDQTAIREKVAKLREKEDQRLVEILESQTKNADDMDADSVSASSNTTLHADPAESGDDDDESGMEQND